MDKRQVAGRAIRGEIMKEFRRNPTARAVSAALAGSVIVTTMAVPALAQDVADCDAAIDAIYVTAPHRQEILSEMPSNISVIGAAET